MKEETEDAITAVYDSLIGFRDKTSDPVVLDLIATLLIAFSDWEECEDE